MQSRDASSTRHKILDACEQIYAEAGIEGLTLRGITEKANVNLAAVNYHFGTKEILVGEMLKRQLLPLHAERLALLDVIEAIRGDQIRPVHVLAAILLPSMRVTLRHPDPKHWLAFFMRCSSDPSPLIRLMMERHFGEIAKRFDRALIKSCPKLTPEETLWRSRIFFNAFPGTVANQNTITMLHSMLQKTGTSCHQVLMQFGRVLECIADGRNDETTMRHLVDDTLQLLQNTTTLDELRTLLPLH